MAPKGSRKKRGKKIKVIETKNPVVAVQETSFNDVVDDCLEIIFSYLTDVEKLVISSVCKRWARISLKKLTINKELGEKYHAEYDNQDEENFIPFLKNVIQKCGPYINSLTIDKMYSGIPKKGNFNDLIMCDIAKYCNNLKHCEYSVFSKDTFPENYFKMLFDNNADLSSLSLSKLRINGHSFSKINPHKIKKLSIKFCEFNKESYLHDFLSQLINVENIKIYSYWDESKVIINSLNEINCKCITEFNIDNIPDTADDLHKDNLLKLLLNQTNLIVLRLFLSIKLDQKFIEKLTKNHIESLSLSFCYKNLELNLSGFKKLKYLCLEIEKLTDTFVKSLSECINLKQLELCFGEYSLSPIGESYFGLLKNLEYCMMNSFLPKTPINLLGALSQCEKLRDLFFEGIFVLTEDSIKKINLFKNLKTLRLLGAQINNKSFCELIRKSPKLLVIKTNDICRILTDAHMKVVDNIIKRRQKINKDSNTLLISHPNHRWIEYPGKKKIDEFIPNIIEYSYTYEKI